MTNHAQTLAVVLVLLLAFVLLALPPARADTLPVTDCGDNGAPGQLRQVIAAANPGDTITVPGCMITLTTPANPLVIDKSLTIAGAGVSKTILDGHGWTQVVTIGPGSAVAISGLTIQHGMTAGFGGGIYIGTTSTLTLTDSRVDRNAAGPGGGIFNDGTLTVINGTVSGNIATGMFVSGGGIQSTGPMTLINTTVSNNFASYGGGGIDNGGPLTLTNSTISHNIGGRTGGIDSVTTSAVVLTNSTISDNVALRTDLAIFTGGILADNVTAKNTIIANNSGGNCHADAPGGISSAGHNLSSDESCAFGSAGDRNDTNPLLGPLQNNGGPTQTHALLPGSPAIDAGDDNGCPQTDQRGVRRSQGSHCDIGAFEVAVAPPPLTISPPSGRYVSTQGFDLVLVVSPLGQAIVGGQVTVDGADVTAALVQCVVPGTLVGGFTARCPNLRGALLGPGSHTVGVTLNLSDGTSLSDAVVWEVDANTEP